MLEHRVSDLQVQQRAEMLTFMLTGTPSRFETSGGGCLILELEEVLIVLMRKFSTGFTVGKLDANKPSDEYQRVFIFDFVSQLRKPDDKRGLCSLIVTSAVSVVLLYKAS